MTEMREFVNSFYRDMTVKICSIVNIQKRELRDMKTQRKYLKECGKFSKHGEESLESSLFANSTVSTWTKEKQFARHKEIVQLSGSVTNVNEESQQIDLPNAIGLDNFWHSSSVESTPRSRTNGDRGLSAIDWRFDATESNV